MRRGSGRPRAGLERAVAGGTGDARGRRGAGALRLCVVSPVLIVLLSLPTLACAQVVVEGVVVDSTRSRSAAGGAPAPLSSAGVWASGVAGQVTSDADGRFRLELPGAGSHRLTFRHPRLDTLGIEDVGWTTVEVPDEGLEEVELAVPSWTTLYHYICGREPGEDPDAIVAGWVSSTLTDSPLPDLRVELRSTTARERPLAFAAETGQDGLFLFCFVPPGATYRLTGDVFGVARLDEAVEVSAGDVVHLDLAFEVGGQGDLRGVVREGEDGDPVPGARVELDGPTSRNALTDRDGGFRMADLPAGRYELSVTHLAFRDVSREVDIPGGDQLVTVEVRVLPDAVALEPITVEVESRRPSFGPLVDVYDRMDRMRQLGLGRIFDREEIEQSRAIRISHLVSRVVGVRARPVPGSPNLELRLNHNDCAPSVYVDGLRLGWQIDDVSISDVEAVEVYRRMTQLPGEFWDETSAHCGAVAIWTRRGR